MNAKAEFLNQNARPGEVYAGLILRPDGDYHLFLLPGEATGVTWAKAKAFAKKADGELPTRDELRVLYANAKAEFQPDWYWSCEQHASVSGYAWMQDFGYGYQYYDRKGYEHRARAVRRLKIS